MLLPNILVIMAGILAARIRMMNQATARLATPDCHQQGITYRVNLHPARQRPAGAYVDDANGSVARFQWVKAPTSEELTRLTHQIALRIGRFLERRGVLVRDAENSYLTTDAVDEDPMPSLVGHSISYRIAVGPHAARKVFTLQTLPTCDEPDAGKVAGFSLHAGGAAKAGERKKLERLCRYIARPAVSEKRLSLTPNGNVRYDVKGFTSVAGAWMRRSDRAEDPVS